jgi:hypothetical protein
VNCSTNRTKIPGNYPAQSEGAKTPTNYESPVSKKSKSKKPKLTISSEGWSWLAANTGDDWNRILDLRGIGSEAVYSFIKSRTSPDSYKQFEELNMSPDALAVRRKVEALKKQAEEDERLTIHNYAPPVEIKKQLTVGGPRWKSLGTTEAERQAAEAKAKAEGEELYIIPEAIF